MRLLGLLLVRDEMRFLPGWLENVRPHVDGIVALDDRSVDGSGDFLRAQPEVLEVLESGLPPHAPFADGPLRRRLTEAAWTHGADWLLAVDADERLERDFRTRAEPYVAAAEREGRDGLLVAFRELWGAPDRYRVDGVWGRKQKSALFRARTDHEFDPRPLHGVWSPLNAGPAWELPEADLIIWHLRMIEEADRIARRARYEALDPEHRWQSIGYAYLTDPTGLELAPVPEGRGF
jgi:hypothetical protein